MAVAADIRAAVAAGRRTWMPSWPRSWTAFGAEAFGGGPVRAGAVHALPRPLATPRRVLLVGAGAGDEAGWRGAGAALARAAAKDGALTILMPAGSRCRRGARPGRGALAGVLHVPPQAARRRGGRGQEAAPGHDRARTRPTRCCDALDDARATAVATRFARDLTNTPSEQKTPEWFADEVIRVAAGNPALTVKIRSGDALADEGFGGIVAVGAGSTRSPRLVELSWQPAGADRARGADRQGHHLRHRRHLHQTPRRHEADAQGHGRSGGGDRGDVRRRGDGLAGTHHRARAARREHGQRIGLASRRCGDALRRSHHRGAEHRCRGPRGARRRARVRGRRPWNPTT